MKLLKQAVIILMLLNLTGCWSKVELDELTFVYGLYIDVGKEPGTVEVSISSPLPNRLMSGTQTGSGTGDGKAYTMVSKTARTLQDATIMIQKDLSRRIEISHIKIVVLGNEYARQGIGEVLEWFERKPEFPLGTYIMAAPGKAKDIFKLTPVFEQLPDQVLMNIANENIMFNTSVMDCILAEVSNMGYAMNYLSFGKKDETSEQGKTEYWAGVQGVMLFHDAKMKGILDVKQSRALAWGAGHLAGRLKLPEYTITWDEEGKGTASAIFQRNSSSSSVKMTSGGPVFHIKVKGSASITFFKDSEGRSASKLSPLIKRRLQEQVVKEISDSLRTVQDAQVDVLQLGMLVEWNYPKAWSKLRERWTDYYAHHAEIKVTADFTIEDFGSER